MYTIYNDGQLLFNTAGTDDEHIILSPKCCPDVNGAGSLEFVMPPGHAQYDAIRKLKGIITVKQDDKIIFRGRAMEDEKDFYNQKNVYCEGDRSFLMDSQCAPYKFTGKVIELLQRLVDDHNSQVEEDKRFTPGNITAVSADETLTVENVAYWETWKEIDEKLLSVYGGYMMTRTEGNTTYLDWLEVSGRTNAQTIAFSVNLLDLKDKVDAADVFTILIPLGASEMGEDGEYSDPVSIASVNGGLSYIQDDEAVALYGKIWRTKTWNHVEDPAQLLRKGQDYMKTGIALHTLTLQAIDMHFIDGSAEAIRVGDHVRILSDPHGLDLTIICTRIDIDLLNPENTTYTFGEAPRALSDNVVQTEEAVSELTGGGGGGGGRSVKQELKDYIRWADIRVDADEATIDMLTGEVSQQGRRLSTAEINLDGVNAQIVLKADVEVTDELGRRVSAAEIEIDGLNSEINLKADKVTIDSELTTINSEMTRINKYFAGSATAAKMVVTNLTAVSLTANGNKCAWTSKEVVTGVRGSLGYMDPFNVVINASTGATRAIRLANGVNVSADTEMIYYMTWA
ncbi:MAG: phage tail protein [Oscillospiraceae bacterium]|nr:phage tail protein [Oscillospiraceae bacterium]